MDREQLRNSHDVCSKKTGAADMVGLIGRGLILLARANLLEIDSIPGSELAVKRSRRRSSIDEPLIVSITVPKERRERVTTTKLMAVANAAK